MSKTVIVLKRKPVKTPKPKSKTIVTKKPVNKPKPKPKTTKPKPKKIVTVVKKGAKTPLKQKDFPLKKTAVKKPVKSVRWQMDEPKGQQRIQLHKVCPKCVLIAPKKSAPLQIKKNPKNYKFPVCTKLSKNTKPKCELNCTGVLAANRRARLTKIYPNVQKLTGKLLQKFKCTKASVAREKQNLINKKNKK